MEAVFQANSLVFALCDLALYLFLLRCGVDFKFFGIGMCSKSVASPDSQAFCCKTGLLPSVFFFCVFSGCIVCCSICISYLCSVSCRLTKWEGLSLIHGWVFTVSSWVHGAAILITLLCNETAAVSKWLLPPLWGCPGSRRASEKTCPILQDLR